MRTQLYIRRQRTDSWNIAIYIQTDIRHDEKSHKCEQRSNMMGKPSICEQRSNMIGTQLYICE